MSVLPIPEDSALFRLLTAAHQLTQATESVIACAHAPKVFADDVAASGQDGAFTVHPLDEAFDAIAEAMVELHCAGGENPQTEALVSAAATWLLGGDQ